MKAAIMGYGTIGSGVAKVLETNKDILAERIGEPLELKYIQETLKTFIVTNGNYKETSESPLKNKHKGDKGISRGRNAKQF